MTFQDSLTRRHLIALGSGLLLADLAPAFAQNRPVSFVVPFPAGGTTDILARMLAEHLQAADGFSIVIENRPGAGTTTAAAAVSRAAPDGQTLLMATSTTLAINATLFSKLPYDPAADFAPIGLVAAVPLVLITHPALGLKSVTALLEYIKSKPEGLPYGSAGPGTPHHLAAEMFKAASATNIRHVSYGGSVAAMNDVVGGHIPFMFMDLPPALPLIAEGKVTALAVTSSKRLAAAPTLPSLDELGFRGFEAVAWQGVVAPAKTPPDIINRLHRSIAAFLARPETQQKLIALGLEPRTSTPEDFAAYIKSEIVRWGDVVRASGAKLDP